MVSWLTQQRDSNLSAVCPVCRREISAEDAAPYINPQTAPSTLSAQTLMMLLTLMCTVPCGRGRPGNTFWGHAGGAVPTPSQVEEEHDEDTGENEDGWRERLAALYAPPADDSDSESSDEEATPIR